jgi:DNA-3-methyladenine glycosylase II
MSDTDLKTLYAKARRHIARRDERMKELTGRVGPCTLRPEASGFVILVRAIVSQLISTAAARTISARVEAVCGTGGITPTNILALSEQKLREQGLSGSKARGIRDLAERTLDGRLPVDQLPQMSDEEALTRLIEVKGIGTWTAEMYLIFSLGRLDVLPVGDFGLRDGVRVLYGLEDMPAKKRLTEIGEAWRPYRSIGTWYVWRSKGGVPQSE